MLNEEEINDLIYQWYIDLSEFKEDYLSQDEIERITEEANERWEDPDYVIWKVVYENIYDDESNYSVQDYTAWYISWLKEVIE